jgi:rootletin
MSIVILFLLCHVFSSRSSQQVQHQADRLRNSLEVTTSELQQLERTRKSLVDQLDSMTAELQRLQAANSNLQKDRDRVEDEKEDALKDLDRQIKENERWYIHHGL